MIPKAGEVVRFTKRIIELLIESRGSSPIIKYDGISLVVMNISKTPAPDLIVYLESARGATLTLSIMPDGTIGGPSLKEMEGVQVLEYAVSVPEPRNNDGRRTCFWCDVPTQKRGGGMYDVCPRCQR